MLHLNKKLFNSAAVIALLSISLQPAHAGKSSLPLVEEISGKEMVAHHLTLKDPEQELSLKRQNLCLAESSSWMPEFLKETGSYSLSALKGLAQFPRLASKGIIYAVKHPMKALTLGLAGQVVAASALSINVSNELQKTAEIQNYPSIESLKNGDLFVPRFAYSYPLETPDDIFNFDHYTLETPTEVFKFDHYTHVLTPSQTRELIKDVFDEPRRMVLIQYVLKRTDFSNEDAYVYVGNGRDWNPYRRAYLVHGDRSYIPEYVIDKITANGGVLVPATDVFTTYRDLLSLHPDIGDYYDFADPEKKQMKFFVISG